MSETQSTTGTRTPLSRDRVLAAAIELADAHGFDSLSMRKLADHLGVGAMSLYHHVPNKEELLDGMVDIVFAEVDSPALGGDWKAEMRKRGISTREVLRRHRWAVGLLEGRSQPGPANLKLHDDMLGCLREAGFPPAEAVHANSVQDAYIYGFMLQEQNIPDSTEEIAEFIDQQVEHVERDLEAEAFAESYPYLAEVVLGHVATAGFQFDEEFEWGLDLILDSLERRLNELTQ